MPSAPPIAFVFLALFISALSSSFSWAPPIAFVGVGDGDGEVVVVVR